ncbi:hypothetical protein JTE90_004569 [Oedothorax gibbosus]|uniref:Uncharacterized protein n=1 Tax=Oedothorax gibbosus TaxID=931172 RepID=A0AAV6UJV1_9ARAC|nr:hypothetical protein JTE90_004569 [Oedothorax gibbosus]
MTSLWAAPDPSLDTVIEVQLRHNFRVQWSRGGFVSLVGEDTSIHNSLRRRQIDRWGSGSGRGDHTPAKPQQFQRYFF